MPERVVYFNGTFVPESEARISIFDSALWWADMAFEVFRTYNSKPFAMRDHIERLYASLKLLEIDCGLSIEQMEAATLDTLQRNSPTEPRDVDWWVVHGVSRGPLEVYASVFKDGCRPTVCINCWPLIVHMGGFAPKYDTGLDLVIPAQHALPAHLVDAKAKTRSRMHYQMANLQAKRQGDGCLPILLDTDGFLTEGAGSNILLVKDGVLLSPEPRNILRGVSRATTIQLAQELKIPVRETNLDRYDALVADEIVCTSTSFSIVHARSFEGQAVGDGKMGPVTRRLVDAWKKHVGIDFVAQAHDYAGRVADWEKKQQKT